VHGVCGAWGLLAVGLFADGTYGIAWNGISPTALHGVQGIFYGDGGQFVAQVIAAVVGFIWAWGITYLIFIVIRRWVKLRVDPEVEIAGLDEAEFGQFCYPDFVIRAETDLGVTHELDAPGAVQTQESTQS
jgi:Amt family ammonium transporter